MITNAQHLGVTNTCEAADCPYDADTWGLCSRHARQQARGQHVRMHVVPDPLPNTLRCNQCNQWKTEDEFPMIKPGKRCGGRKADRRGRYCNCLICEAKLRRERRDRRTPEKVAEDAARANAVRRERRARLKANPHGEPTAQVEG